MKWVWLVGLILFAVLEASTSALVSIWFIGGALAALIAALCGGVLWLQILLFFSVSAGLLLLFRPLVKACMAPHKETMNAASNIGKDAIVTERIDNLRGAGAVRIAGVEWSARSVDKAPIEAGAVVRVTAIEGAKVLVIPITKKEEK